MGTTKALRLIAFAPLAICRWLRWKALNILVGSLPREVREEFRGHMVLGLIE